MHKHIATIELKGGLGNQMFQIAFGYALQENGYIVIYDTLFFVKQYIDHLWSPSVAIRDLNIGNIFPNLKLKKKNMISALLSRIMDKMRQNKCLDIYEKWYSHYDSRLLTQLGPCPFCRGFYQNEEYFSHIKEKILHIFRFRTLTFQPDIEVATRISKHKNSVCVHVRRGDYVKAGLTLASPAYYAKAIKLIMENVEAPFFFIFGQDAKDFIENEIHLVGNYEIVEVKRQSSDYDYVDMQLMSMCRHFIIANSTFSWWAAWLSNSDGMVIAPSPWLRGKSDIICKKWIKIEC